MNWKMIIGSAIVFGPLFWVLAAGFGNDPHAVPFVLAGKEASDFELTSLDGTTVKLSDFRGKPVVINFWSTWCQPCKIEHPILLDAARIYQPMGVRFVSVLYQDDAAKARVYLRKNGSEWPTLVDPGGRTAISYGVAGVPETFFIDRNGVVVHKVAGPVGAEEMITTLQGML